MKDNNLNGTTPETDPATNNGEKKEGILDKAKKRYIVFRSTKGGRWTIRILKGLGLGVAAKTIYDKGFDAGKKTVPDTIVIHHEPEPEMEPETPEEEPVNNEG